MNVWKTRTGEAVAIESSRKRGLDLTVFLQMEHIADLTVRLKSMLILPGLSIL